MKSNWVYICSHCSGLAALERKLLSHICEDGERHLFSSIPNSRLPPGIPEISSNVREPPYRVDTDTPTFTGDFRRVQMMVRRTNQFFLYLPVDTEGSLAMVYCITGDIQMQLSKILQQPSFMALTVCPPLQSRQKWLKNYLIDSH